MPRITYLVVTGIPEPGDMTEPYRELLAFVMDVGLLNHTFTRMSRMHYKEDHEATIMFKDQSDYVRFKLRFGDDFKIRTCFS